jgi:acetoin utilization deacetylase AcuC-like enzyme
LKVGIVRNSIYLQHFTDDFHPENPRRLESIYEMVNLLDRAGLVDIPARLASEEEIGLVHEASYIRSVRETKGRVQMRLDPDTVTSAQSYDAACTAVGGVLSLADAVISGAVDNGFALVRPPGHHAEAGRAMGFCIFNNIAIAAKYVQRRHGIGRVLIVDFDLHHGNGTQHSFYDAPSVLYVSTHQYPYYPGTGWYTEVGEKEGEGYTVNVPLTYGMADVDYLDVFREIVRPLSRLYRPEIVMVSAGYDIHKIDPLGGMAVTEGGFSGMTRILLDIAQTQCGGKLLFVLEGGYNIEALTNSVKATIAELRRDSPYVGPEPDGHPCDALVRTVSKVKEVIGPYWGSF